ncbi:hypothetical protein MVEN_01776500 [Mycena venus]|uniref:Uncharacterized protein n=1 Tax=Mycena venus TaxID=2733690 RepID=A0A8H7CQ55_9AGAR|nr:hypothetical protein MVEN_01776500 [Mycena venus]
MAKKRKAESSPAPTTDKPAKRRRGRPPKNPNTPKDTVEDTVPKLTLKIPSRSDKSTSPTSNSDSEVIDTSDNGSSVSIDDDDNDLDLVQAATEGLLGLSRRKSKNDDNDYEDAENTEEQEEEKEQEQEEEEEEQDEEEEEEDENFVFDLDFVVPVGGATDTLTVSSTITHTELFSQIAEEMGVRKKDLVIAYKFSWSKDKDKPKLLNTPAHMVKVFKDAREELVDRKKLAHKKPDAKALKKKFEVVITDLSAKHGKEKTDKAAKKPQSKGKRRTNDSDSEADVQVDKGKMTPAEALRELEQDRRCEKHDCFCVVAENGEHITLTNNNMSLWSLMLSQGLHTSKTLPPATLGLPMTTGTKSAAPSRRAPQNAPPPPPPPFPYYYPPGPYPHAYYPPPPAPPTHLPDPAPAPPATNLKKTISIDSSDDDDPTLFPTIKDWLLELDTSERGQDGHHFSQYGDSLRTNGFARVVQLADEGEKEGATLLREMCPEMSVGVARLLMRYAVKDCEKIRKAEKQRKVDWARTQ